MAFDQATRNRLSKFVSDTRKLLSDEFAQQMRVKYGLDPATGVVTDIDKLPTMAEGDRQTAQMLRDTLEHYLATAPKRDKKTVATTIDRIVREQAFTVLNRLCAVRMAESRELVIESIAQGTKSKGFQLYARLAGSALGETGEAYVSYLFSLFDELSIDLPVLFDRFSQSGRLFPRESVLIDVLGQINHHELQHLWAEDETIGWIYQYFNSDEERKAMRDVKAGGSAAPRNSRELAVRNQFFTPRYVVEFLTDNTLGRIWYEMTQGQTRLVDSCKYLVRRPDEVFLSQMTSKDQEHPSDGTIAMAELLLSGTEETFPEFSADDPQPMIELAHCVDAYATMGDRAHEILGNRTLIVRERPLHEPSEVDDAVGAAPYVFAGQLEMLKTQHILEVLFMTCRSDRHGGDGSVYSEFWFVDACNGVRRRVLNSRRDDLSQEELLCQPVFIPYRPMKDPRDIKMLDPACGSMHFGLYAFDLFLSIYEEAWVLEERLGDRAFVRPRELKSLRDSYNTIERYTLDVPRLIIERNIHGIDIDARAVQIAGLSLWLRAQKAWHEAGFKPAARPQITRSNIVCAEPMPGESDLLEQFIRDHLSQTSEQQTIASIVRRVFDAMKLAGEAGSLLKIEEEIAGTIAEAKKKWVDGPKALQLPLFAIDAKQKDSGARPLLVAGIDDAAFWDEIEDRIYESLRAYGEQAVSEYQRRLFVNDAVQGFAFIDTCRNRYDVILMNPPFGEFTESVRDIAVNQYSCGNTEIIAAFVERAISLGTKYSLIAAISSRTPFFQSTTKHWRSEIVLRYGVRLFVDLGGGVLDSAMVETAMYVLGKQSLKSHALFASYAQEHEDNSSLFNLPVSPKAAILSPGAFTAIDGAPFAYWLTATMFRCIRDFDTLEDSGVFVRVGLQSGDDFRFIRLWWEVPSNPLRWRSHAKGGENSPYFTDIHLVVNWFANGKEIKSQSSVRLNMYSGSNKEFESITGLTFSYRTFRFSPAILPAGCIAGVAGMGVFSTIYDIGFLVAFLNSSYVNEFISARLNRRDLESLYQAGVVAPTPMPNFSEEAREELTALGERMTILARSLYAETETSLSFSQYGYTERELFDQSAFDLRRSETIREILASYERVDELSAQAYEFPTTEGRLIHERGRELLSERCYSISDEGVERHARDILSYVLGCIFGRWDVRFCKAEGPVNTCFGQSLDLPNCAVGMLKNDAGLPLSMGNGSDAINSANYPLKVEWEGILADTGYGRSIFEDRIHAALEEIFPENTDAIERQLCQLLKVPNICEWFRRPSNFFADHLQKYSKSRRQAPIYWPLSSSGGNLILWIYSQRVTDQILFSAVNNFVDPKLKEVTDELKLLRAKDGRSSDEEALLERVSNIAAELIEFREDLLSIAAIWKPNLDDGVQIASAPLWRFFQLKKWRELLKKTWEELEQGQYDWAHLALSIWPKRVVRSAHRDRSFAIAHDLEELLWHEVEVKKTSKTGRVTTKVEWQPRELSENELDAIVAKVKSGEIGTDNAAPAEVANG